jgi:hypothetical protein
MSGPQLHQNSAKGRGRQWMDADASSPNDSPHSSTSHNAPAANNSNVRQAQETEKRTSRLAGRG